MRSLLEGGWPAARSGEPLLLGSRLGTRGRGGQGCVPQDFALIAICVISAWHLDQSFGAQARLPGRRAVGQAAEAEGPGGAARPVGAAADSSPAPRPAGGPPCRRVRVPGAHQRASASRAAWPLLFAPAYRGLLALACVLLRTGSHPLALHQVLPHSLCTCPWLGLGASALLVLNFPACLFIASPPPP